MIGQEVHSVIRWECDGYEVIIFCNLNRDIKERIKSLADPRDVAAK